MKTLWEQIKVKSSQILQLWDKKFIILAQGFWWRDGFFQITTINFANFAKFDLYIINVLTKHFTMSSIKLCSGLNLDNHPQYTLLG